MRLGGLTDGRGARLILAIPIVAILIAGWSRRWTADDAFIYLRVVDNLRHGFGPVFNNGERVEAYTSPIWLALLTSSSALLTPPAPFHGRSVIRSTSCRPSSAVCSATARSTASRSTKYW